MTLTKRFFQCVTVGLCWLVALSGTVGSVQAGEYAALRESLRARSMGGAFTAVANDEYSLFYNPAGLRSVYYNIFTLVGASTTFNKTTEDFSKESNASSALSSYSGKKLYLEPIDLGLLSFVNSRFGWSFFGNSVFDFSIDSISASNVDSTFKAYGQFGGVLGGAWSFLDHQLDLGISGKIANRNGAETTVTVTEQAIIDAYVSQNTAALENSVKTSYDNKTAYSADVGVVYHLESFYTLSPKLALSYLGELNFGGAGKIPGTLNFGAATESEFSGIDIIMAADYVDLLDAQKLTGSKLRLGFELGVEKLNNGHHIASFRIGHNGYLSSGISLNLWKLKIDYAQYSQTISSGLEDKRKSLGFSLVF